MPRQRKREQRIFYLLLGAMLGFLCQSFSGSIGSFLLRGCAGEGRDFQLVQHLTAEHFKATHVVGAIAAHREMADNDTRGRIRKRA
jgi:hypothetical protein